MNGLPGDQTVTSNKIYRNIIIIVVIAMVVIVISSNSNKNNVILTLDALLLFPDST